MFPEKKKKFADSKAGALREMYSIQTGHVVSFLPSSRRVKELIKSCDGFIGYMKAKCGVYWFFDSKYNVISARNQIRYNDIRNVSDTVLRWELDKEKNVLNAVDHFML